MKLFAVFIWVFFTASSAILGLFALSGLASVDHSGGPGAPLEGVAVLMGFGVLAACAVVFIVCMKLHPAKEAFTAVNLIVSLAIYGGIIVTFCVLPRATAGYTLTVQVLDSSRKPIQAAQIRYESFQLGSGLARLASPANGTASTDAMGRVTIHTNHQHRTDGYITKAGYRKASYIVEPMYFNRHQLSIAWDSYGLPSGHNEHVFGDILPADKEVLLTIFLPGVSERDNLPYVAKSR